MFFISLMMIPRDSGAGASSGQPFSRQPSKTNMCQTCGDKGDLKRLIYCAQCQVSAEHSYCMEKLHKDDDGTISWKCEECSLKDANCGSKQLRRSRRISEATEAKYDGAKIMSESTSPAAKYSRVKIKSENTSHEVLEKHEHAYMGKSCEAESSDGNQDLPIKEGRRLEFKDENIIHEENEALTGPSYTPSDQPTLDAEKDVHTKSINYTIDEYQSNMLQGLLYPECNKQSRAEPVSYPAWRGQFRINNTTVLGVVAHLSIIASSKVQSTAAGLPQVLDLQLLSRLDVWPPSFQMSPPTDDNIGLYIFPQSESDKKVFDSVMYDAIERNLALKAIITNNVELLIFSSRVLPPENWRICRKYYLWGVFRQKRRS